MMNEDHALTLTFLRGDRRPVPIATNPLAISLAGMLLELDATAGSSVLSFEPGDQFLQGNGVIQGGIVATMLDFALAFAALTKLKAGESFGTANLSVNLLKPARCGLYQGRGRIIRAGKTLTFAAAELSGADGLIATATSVMAITTANSTDV